MCYLPNPVIEMGLDCAWNPPDESKSIKQVFMVRNPLSRALSVYYFWGELFKLKASQKRGKHRSLRERLGKLSTEAKGPIKRTFLYHGDESTVPPEDTAIAYAKKLPYNRGMPGILSSCALFNFIECIPQGLHNYGLRLVAICRPPSI